MSCTENLVWLSFAKVVWKYALFFASLLGDTSSSETLTLGIVEMMAPQTSETELVGGCMLADWPCVVSEIYSFLQLSSEIRLVKGRFPLHVASKQPYFCLFHREQIAETVLLSPWHDLLLHSWICTLLLLPDSSCRAESLWMGGFCTLTLTEARLTRGRLVLDRLPAVRNVLYS